MSAKHLVRKMTIASACVAGILLVAMPASADRLYRKSSSKPITGELTFSKESVTVTPRVGDPVVVPVSDVDRINWDGQPATLGLVYSLEAQGEFAKALAKYEAELPKTQGDTKTEVEFLIARTTAKLGLTDESKLGDAVAKLEAFRSANPNNFRYYSTLKWLGEAYLASGDYSKARDMFEQLEKSQTKETRLTARNAQARVLLKEGKIDEAASIYDSVIRESVDGPAETSRRYEAMLGKANCLMAETKYADAVSSLDEVIHELAPEDTRNLAQAYLLKGDSLQALHKPKDARLAYLHVDVLFSQESAAHAEALYKLAKVWNELGRQDRAKEAASRLSSDYAGSSWAKKLAAGS